MNRIQLKLLLLTAVLNISILFGDQVSLPPLPGEQPHHTDVIHKQISAISANKNNKNIISHSDSSADTHAHTESHQTTYPEAPTPADELAQHDNLLWQDANSKTDSIVFQDMLKKEFPISPEQMRAYREILNKYERELQHQVRNPTPVISTKSVSLDTGSSPTAIRTATGYVSSVLFVDETGAQWPIAAYDIGNPKAFNINWDKKSNLLLIQGTTPYANTNMVVLLKDLDSPILLSLINDQKDVDYRLDLRIARQGPNAKTAIMQVNLPESTDKELMNLLDGVPPVGNTRLLVQGGNAQAWLDRHNKLLLRTKFTVLSPTYNNYVRSADGMNVYRMEKTPLILVAKNGDPVELTIEGY